MLVKINDPVVQFLDILVQVQVVFRWWPIVWEPDKLGWVKKGGIDQLILSVRVVGVLGLHHLLQVEEPSHNAVPGGIPDQVIETKVGNNNGQLLIANATSDGARKPPGPNICHPDT